MSKVQLSLILQARVSVETLLKGTFSAAAVRALERYLPDGIRFLPGGYMIVKNMYAYNLGGVDYRGMRVEDQDKLSELRVRLYQDNDVRHHWREVGRDFLITDGPIKTNRSLLYYRDTLEILEKVFV